MSFLQWIEHKGGDDAALMLRVYLNQLYDARVYPVDLADLSALGFENRRAVWSFIGGCAADPHPCNEQDGARVVALLKELS